MDNLKKCLLTTVESDSHMWNLVYMQLFLEEHGYDTYNLGCCVSENETITAIKSQNPSLIVVSSVNGHGYVQGKSLVQKIKNEFGHCCPTIVIGGKLSTQISDNSTIHDDLLSRGYDGVFVNNSAINQFKSFLKNHSISPSILSIAS